MELGKNLIQICKEKRITPTQLTRITGVKQPTLHGLIAGKKVHNTEGIKRLTLF